MDQNDNKACLSKGQRIDGAWFRKAASDVLGLAGGILAGVEKDGWESPNADRKLWRKEKPGGGYEYREDPPGSPPKHKPIEKKKVVYKNYLKLDKPKLVETLSRGHFSILSAGMNSKDPKEKLMDPDDQFFHKRHDELRHELEANGLAYTEVVGHYGGGIESSFLVFHDDTPVPQRVSPRLKKSMMVHHRDAEEAKTHKKIIEDLGKKFNQDSVLHGNSGRNDLVFTTGEKAGESCGGKGWNEAPEADDNFTEIDLSKSEHTKFQLDIQECFDRGLLG
jgi:hypothetical protein